jgi:hypothetical protein
MEKSFEEIGQELGIGTERARQIYRDGMDKIRVYLKERPEIAEAFFMFLLDPAKRQPSLKILEDDLPSED